MPNPYSFGIIVPSVCNNYGIFLCLKLICTELSLKMFKCPYCNSTTNSLKRYNFPDWYHVAKHAKSCNKKTGEYYIDSVEGPIHYSELLKNYSSSYLRYLYPNLKASFVQIRAHFKKFNIIIPNIDREWKKDELISTINDFVIDNDRIPTNRDFNDVNSVYPSVRPFMRIFKTWNKAIESAGYSPNTNLYGISLTAEDGTKCRSILEFDFINNFLYKKVKYIYEPKYPNPHRLIYDFYLPELDTYVEVAGGTSNKYLQTLNRKIEINKELGRKLLIVLPKDIKNFNSIEDLLDGTTR